MESSLYSSRSFDELVASRRKIDIINIEYSN